MVARLQSTTELERHTDATKLVLLCYKKNNVASVECTKFSIEQSSPKTWQIRYVFSQSLSIKHVKMALCVIHCGWKVESSLFYTYARKTDATISTNNSQ